MRRRTTTLLRGLAALGLLLLVVGGVPIGLVREVGWPLPTVIPAWDQVAHAVTTGSIQDATIIKALAVLVWLAWANFTAALVLEGAALARGRQARRVAGAHTAQRLAANLLTSISIAVAMVGRPAAAVAASQPDELRLAVATALAEQPAPNVPGEPDTFDDRASDLSEVGPDAGGQAGGASTTGHDGRTHQVERGDTLWDLAERFLGDGFRWREIRDANVGRTQPGGMTLSADGQDIRPGWTLVIPGPAQAEVAAGEDDQDEVTVAPGDTLWDLADEHLGDPHRWPDIHEENQGRPQPDGDSLTDPDHIHPGWVLDLPDGQEPEDPAVPEVDDDQPADEPDGSGFDAGPPPAGPTLSAAPAEPTAKHREHPNSQRTPHPEIVSSDEGRQHPLALATSAAALGAGVILTLDRLRRARQRRREPGTRIPLPEGQAAEAEQRLRTLADEEAATFIDLALRELAQASEAGRLPPVTLVTYGPDDLTVHLAGAQPDPPDGWEAQDEGRTWTRRRPADLSGLEGAAGTPSRLPALVTIGTLDDGQAALLNLGHTSCLHLDGDDKVTVELLQAWALELATTPRADALDVITYGIEGLPSDLERLEPIDDEDELRERLASVQPTDSPGPAEILLAAGVDKDLVSWIRIATEQRLGLAAAVAAPPPRPGAWAVTFDGDGACLQPEDLGFAPLDLSNTGFDQASQLLDQAKHPEDRPVPIPPLPEDEAEISPAPEDEPAAVITVRILGKVDVEGAGPFTTNKTMELVVYLAMHRDGADTDTLQEALWPDQPPRPARLYTEASRARKALGAAPDGTPYLPDAEKGIYRLSDDIALDYEQFQTHVAAARWSPEETERHLQAALDLVQGRPLSATATEYAWSINDSYRIAQEIADAAHDLAQHLMEDGRYEHATAAAEAGLKADPLAEVLIRDLMEAAAATGNVARVHALMTRLRRQLAENADANDADDYLHPETIETYERLTRTE